MVNALALEGKRSPTEYQDDIYQEISNEFEQIRLFKGVYIGQGGTTGAFHLFKELFNNALDECTNENSPSNVIYVTFDEGSTRFTVSDEGRGIPFDKLKDVCMKKHTSTKVIGLNTRKKGQAGSHGVGLTVAAALSDYMTITSMRGNESKTIEFIGNEIIEHIDTLKKPMHGLIAELVPSSKYLGKLEITPVLVEEYLRRMSYLLPPGIKIIYSGKEKGSDKPKLRTYSRQGLVANIQYLSSTLEFPPVEINTSNDDFDLNIVFSFDKTKDDLLVESYCNYVTTTEGGTHEIAAQKAICEYLTKEAKKLDPNSKYEVTFDDCRKGLIIIVNCMHTEPAYEGQHKSKLSNRDLLQEGKRELNTALYKYFSKNNALLGRIVSYLRQISRIRMEANKIKGIQTKKPTSFLDDAAIRGFENIANRNYHGYKELYLVEGLSAGQAIANVRNSTNQAIFAIQGVTDNVYGLSTAQLMKKETFNNLVRVLGCGVGKDFNINNLRWNKIIIANDADIDGSNIFSLLMAFFITFLPQLIQNGYIYKALPPLYVIDKRPIQKYYTGNEWLFDKNEFYQIRNTIIASNVSICFEQPNGSITELGKKDALRWLNSNSEYLLELNNLEKRTACAGTILEYVCWYKLIARDSFHFKKLIEKRFPELTYDLDEQSLFGSNQGEFVSLITDDLFMRIASRFIQGFVRRNESIELQCKNKNDKSDRYDKYTIGEFLREMEKTYQIKVDERLKGLGEATEDILFTTTVNPKLRRLIQININDFDETMGIFELLHGKSADMREKRRALLDEAKISFADIDN